MSEATLPAANCCESPLEVNSRPGLQVRREQRDQQRREFLSWIRSQRGQRRRGNDEQGKCKDNDLTASAEVRCFEDSATQQATPEAEMNVARLPSTEVAQDDVAAIGGSTSMGEHLEKLRASLEEQLGTQRLRTIYQSMLEAESAAVCLAQMDCKEAHAVAGLVERDMLFFHVGMEVQAL